ncbi:hypothetical protein C9I90_01585 [Photobacterium aphoticum]|uniref:Uncharacterized protein n=1 Tax=Photobacterium aphoticum TaxID=754436 RepID=A0A0J1JJ80_9GAMM|nr:hypothetical protein ABT58_06830 [Photobacterium aphoticum]PSU60334.1 hypothetical protein C9I90_01585 [Photobacterium aphoticum]
MKTLHSDHAVGNERANRVADVNEENIVAAMATELLALLVGEVFFNKTALNTRECWFSTI